MLLRLNKGIYLLESDLSDDFYLSESLIFLGKGILNLISLF